VLVLLQIQSKARADSEIETLRSEIEVLLAEKQALQKEKQIWHYKR
jgi:hypothetical protein